MIFSIIINVILIFLLIKWLWKPDSSENYFEKRERLLVELQIQLVKYQLQEYEEEYEDEYEDEIS